MSEADLVKLRGKQVPVVAIAQSWRRDAIRLADEVESVWSALSTKETELVASETEIERLREEAQRYYDEMRDIARSALHTDDSSAPAGREGMSEIDLVAELRRIGCNRKWPTYNFSATLFRAADEVERLLDVVESCFSVGEIKFGTNDLATTVRGKVMDVLIEAGRIDGEGRPILHTDDSRSPAGEKE